MPDPDPVTGQLAADPIGMELTPEQAFEIERHSRLLDDISDVQTLRNMAKLLLRAWIHQRAATAWVMRQGLRR
ncbi:MAG: hypothetical protein KGO47_08585 [Cyanobacteria bacterium REEB417]|nr:hypothetical protein [Cyanobacteria bacterium REEB417]